MKHLDKLLHFLACYFIVTVFAVIHLHFAVCVAVIIAIGKEVYDFIKYGKNMGWKTFMPMGFWDFVFDMGGILCGILLAVLL